MDLRCTKNLLEKLPGKGGERNPREKTVGRSERPKGTNNPAKWAPLETNPLGTADV
jgi:hypothetical protein